MGIDHIDELVAEAIKNVNRDPATKDLLKKGNMKLVVGDGRLGYEADAPFDAIHVGAAAPVLPEDVRMILFLDVLDFANNDLAHGHELLK